MREGIVHQLGRVLRYTGAARATYWFIDRIQYYCRDQFKKAIVTTNGKKRASKIAIFAIFQPNGLSGFAKRELDYLVELGYDVALSCPHHLSDADLKYINARCRFVILRSNFGRDFGSYQDGVIGVGFEEISRYARLLLVNDSIFFPIGNTVGFSDELAHPADVITLCENRETLRHLQSFFIDIKTSVFCHPIVKDYWFTYKPFNSRYYAIRKGELGFGKQMFRVTKDVYTIYSQERIFEKMLGYFQESPGLFPFYFLLSDNFAPHIKDSAEKLSYSATKLMRSAVLADRLRILCERSNVTHSFALLLLTTLGAPFLKRDIYFRMSYDLAQIKLALTAVATEEEIREAMGDLHSRGTMRNLDMYGMLLAHLGAR